MRRFLMVLALAGCAMPSGAAVPQAARLSAETVTVTLTDGTVCRAGWAAAGGAGRLDGCGAGFDYRIEPVAKPNPLRQIFEGITGALGAEGALAPMATVVVSGGGRDWRFVSPPPRSAD